MFQVWEFFWFWGSTGATPFIRRINAGEQIAGIVPNLQTGVTYTVVQSDCGKLLSFNNAGAVAVTLPGPASFTIPFWFLVENRGAGAVTITPSSGNIDGGANLVVNQNKGAVIESDGSNYYTMRGGT